MELKYAVPQQFEELSDFTKSLYNIAKGRTQILTAGSCLGYCEIPKNRITAEPFEKTDLYSCSDYLIRYLEALKELFVIYASWHFRLCFIHLALGCLQYFKLPAETSQVEVIR